VSGILIVTTSYPGGGQPAGSEAAGSFAHDFAVSLGRRAHVTVAAPSLEKGTGIGIEDGIEVLRFHVPSLPLSTLRPLDPIHLSRIISVLRSGKKAVEEACRLWKPSHILALWALPSGYWAMEASASHDVPHSTWALGSDIWSLSRMPFVSGVLRRVLASSSYRFADGLELCRDVEAICPGECRFLPSSRLIPYAGHSPSARTEPPYRLSFLGRWHRNKGVDLLLEALLALDHGDWRMIEEVRVFGGGPLEEAVHGKTAELRGAGRPVRTGGYLDRDSAVELYLDSDYLLIPSRIESIPLVFSDAMQCGLPVVCTPAGDLPGLIERFRCGILSSGTDAGSISLAIRSAASADRSGMLEGTRAASSEFSVEAAVNRFLESVQPHSGKAGSAR
jgi:glycosyltransferase involved in cell wall biosynthesis